MNGMLYRKRKFLPDVKIITEKAERNQLLQQYHNGSGHWGTESTFHKLFEHFYWKTMYRDVKRHVETCPECQLLNTKKDKQQYRKIPVSGIF